MSTTSTTIPVSSGRSLPALARRHPISVFLGLAFAVAWPALIIPDITGWVDAPFLLVANFVGLLGAALLVTRWTGGPGAIRALLSRTWRWRFGVGRYATVLLALPIATIAVSVVTGTLQVPDNGWATAVLGYFVMTVLVGALVLNIWEETAWTGFVQSRLMQRHGLLGGSLLTAPLFVAVHLPLLFAPGFGWPNLFLSLGLLLLAAPFMRYLLGMHYLATGSLLAVGLQHASFNASGAFGVGGWQPTAGLVIVTVLLALHRSLRHPQLG